MKKHRFFAWMTVICFLLTMYTGYKNFGNVRDSAFGQDPFLRPLTD